MHRIMSRIVTSASRYTIWRLIQASDHERISWLASSLSLYAFFSFVEEIVFICSVCYGSIYVCTGSYPQYVWLLQCAVFWGKKIFIPLNIMMAYRGIEVWFHLFLSFTLDGVNDQLHVPSALFPGKNFRCPFNKMLDGKRVRSGLLTEQKIRLILLGFEPPDRPSSSPATVAAHKARFLKKIQFLYCLQF